MVQPMKAALYFESAKGFGDWRILISTAAIQDLRETRRKNPSLFKIILKKIRLVCYPKMLKVVVKSDTENSPTVIFLTITRRD